MTSIWPPPGREQHITGLPCPQYSLQTLGRHAPCCVLSFGGQTSSQGAKLTGHGSASHSVRACAASRQREATPQPPASGHDHPTLTSFTLACPSQGAGFSM